LDGGNPATSPHEKSKAPGAKRIIGQPGQLFLFHLAANPTQHPPDLDLQIDSGVPAGKISNPAQPMVVEGPMNPLADSAVRLFSRRVSRMT